MLFVLIMLICLADIVTAKEGDLSSSQKEFEEYYWGDWTGWSSCDRLCSRSDGSRSRIRICFRIANTQRLIASTRTCESTLEGRSHDTEECYEPECDGSGQITAMWSSWEAWTCSYDEGICGKGTKTRVRHCTNPESVAMDGGRVGNARCPKGDTMEEDDCFAKCPDQLRNDKYGGWSDWSPWICTEACTPGVQAVRTRACDNPPPVKGYTCPGEDRMSQPCNGKCRKAWADWGDWTNCHKTCDQPLRVRKRKCEGLGLPCEGEATEQSECMDTSRHTLCPPVDGSWGVWSHWTTECSVTCGDGVTIRERECNNPAQAGLGQDCVGATNLTRPCVTGLKCPIHGIFREWTEWSECTATCGGGMGRRTRGCIKPKFGGRTCEGLKKEKGPCNVQSCPPPTIAPALVKTLDDNLQDSEFSIMKQEGQMAEMVCKDMKSIQQYFPDATSVWIKNGQRLTLDGLRIQLDRRMLVFEEVKPEDSGVYLCQSDYGGPQPLTAAVYALAVMSARAQVSIHEGKDFELTCNGAQLGLLFPGCTQKWVKDGRTVKNYGDMQPQEVNVEIFQHADPRFSGLYSCVVSHNPTDRQWTTNIVNVTVLPPLGLVDVILAKAQTNMKLAGGAAGGAVGLFTILVCMCVITCRSKDKKSAKGSSATPKKDSSGGGDDTEHVALYTDDYGDDYSAGNNAADTSYDYSGYQDSSYDNTGYDAAGYDNAGYDNNSGYY